MNSARPTFDDDADKPLDPAVEKVRRKLVRFIAINLGLLMVALMAVALAIVYKSRTEPATGFGVAGAIVEGEIALPHGARIASQSLSDKILSLHIVLSDGQQAIFLYSVNDRRLVGRFAVTMAN